MILDVLPQELAVSRLQADAVLPQWATSGSFHSIVRTSDELCIVCPDALVPESVPTQRGWRCLRVRGPLAFELTGILASLAVPLAQAEVSIFAISTYDTDYILVRREQLARAIAALRAARHEVNGLES